MCNEKTSPSSPGIEPPVDGGIDIDGVERTRVKRMGERNGWSIFPLGLCDGNDEM